MKMTRRTAALCMSAAAFGAARRRDEMRVVPAADAVTIREEKGWYMHSVGVVALDDELVCTYRRSDEHVASQAEVWCTRSRDGGRTWTDHRMITRLGWEPDKACWIAPQLNRTRDGWLVMIVDRGEKLSKFDWPMLSQWQMKDRGMSNWLFVSKDRGHTWEGPRKIDDVGGEPGYVLELSSGTWMYTRTDSRPTSAKKFPSMPWGPNYYRSTAVFSDDRGKTWPRTVSISDDPLVGDCEVGVAEYAPGKLLAITRIGDAGSSLGQPSRFVYSNDFGATWSKPVLSPIYAHRPYVRPLQSGKLFVSYRNAWGTTGTCGIVLDPAERYTYQPNSMIWDEACCRIRDGAMELRTGEGRTAAVEFTLYPMEDDDSVVEFEADLRVASAGPNACNISAGGWVRFLAGRVELAGSPEQGFALDTGRWRKYRMVNSGHRLAIWVDGEKKLDAPVEGGYTRLVRFGNRSGAAGTVPAVKTGREAERKPLRGINYEANAGVSFWRSIRVQVKNRRDHSIDWRWSASAGYPDQFRRDRVIRMEKNASFAAGDSGYSSWAQLPDGTVVVGDYTAGDPAREHPALRAYRLSARELLL
jgi:hypothetical protein